MEVDRAAWTYEGRPPVGMAVETACKTQEWWERYRRWLLAAAPWKRRFFVMFDGVRILELFGFIYLSIGKFIAGSIIYD